MGCNMYINIYFLIANYSLTEIYSNTRTINHMFFELSFYYC